MPDRPKQVTLDAELGVVSISLESGLYPLEAVYGAAYAFIDRCYVLLDAPEEKRLVVQLRGRDTKSEPELQALAGEFGNELLGQAWRLSLVERQRPELEGVTARALAGAAGQPGTEALDGLGDDAFDDPLGIAVPWEEKYGKDTPR
jgi:His-Xaa-Ser system protein HxsD